MLVERILKIIIVGDSGTGKTSLIRKYINKNKNTHSFFEMKFLVASIDAWHACTAF